MIETGLSGGRRFLTASIRGAGRKMAVMWYVAYSRPNQEHAVLAALERLGHPAWLPAIDGWTKRGRKRVKMERVLFPGYLFAGLVDGQGWFDRRRVDGLLGFISMSGEPLRVSSAVVDELKGRIATDEFLVKRRTRLMPGQSVQIVNGPMQGVKGRLRVATEMRAEVLVDLLCQQVPGGYENLDDDGPRPVIQKPRKCREIPEMFFLHDISVKICIFCIINDLCMGNC